MHAVYVHVCLCTCSILYTNWHPFNFSLSSAPPGLKPKTIMRLSGELICASASSYPSISLSLSLMYIALSHCHSFPLSPFWRTQSVLFFLYIHFFWRPFLFWNIGSGLQSRLVKKERWLWFYERHFVWFLNFKVMKYLFTKRHLQK